MAKGHRGQERGSGSRMALGPQRTARGEVASPGAWGVVILIAAFIEPLLYVGTVLGALSVSVH